MTAAQSGPATAIDPSLPLVSVVTPFYNTAPYLAECIESVLAQTYGHFEYLLVNNQSTDGSREIAEGYARLDPRIRLIDNADFVGQVENYNGAVAQIDPRSRYCKLVQADDWLFPDCIRLMVGVAERDPRIWLVSSYYLKGDTRAGDGIPLEQWRVDGRAACRLMVREGHFFLGSPTAVLYRSDAVRSRTPFFQDGRYHEDTEAAYEILLEHDLGFVHQVLTFLRTGNESISSAVNSFNSEILDHLIAVERFGGAVLDEGELKTWRATCRRNYLRFLGRSVFRPPEFWRYHRAGLAMIGWDLRPHDMWPYALAELLRLALDPPRLVKRSMAMLRRRPRNRAAGPSRPGRRSPTGSQRTPTISVVVPTRDRAAHITACVHSILENQGLIELIVVDQSEGKTTEDALRDVTDARLRYVRTATRGVTNARNVGIDLSRGNVVAFTDDDCRVASDWIERLAHVFSTEDPAVVCGRVRVPEDVRRAGIAIGFEPHVREWRGCFPPPDRDWGITANLAIRRDALESVGAFDPLLGAGAPLRSGGEPDLLYRVLKAGLKVVNATEVSVDHYGARAPGAEARALWSGYAVGTGAAIFKYVRLGDPFAIRLYVRWVAFCLVWNVVSVLRGSRPTGIPITLGFLRGSLMSLRYGVDRRSRLYVADRGWRGQATHHKGIA